MRLDTTKLQCVKRGMGGKITARCPACALLGHDKSGQHLSVLPDGRFNCIVGSTEDPSHNRTIRLYLRGSDTDTDNQDVEYIDPAPKLSIDKVYPESVLSKLIPDYTYWMGRGVSAEVLKRLECGVAPLEEKSKLSGRTIFPIRNLEGRIVGFSGRILDDTNMYAPKYKHMFKSSQVCFPWHLSGPHIKRTGSVVLTEGASDLAILLTHDIPNVICLFGLRLNGKIISSLISANVKRIYISLNRDLDPTKGQAACDRIRSQLGAFFTDDAIIIRLPPEGRKDWMECSTDEIAVFRQEINS